VTYVGATSAVYARDNVCGQSALPNRYVDHDGGQPAFVMFCLVGWYARSTLAKRLFIDDNFRRRRLASCYVRYLAFVVGRDSFTYNRPICNDTVKHLGPYSQYIRAVKTRPRATEADSDIPRISP